MKTVSNRTIQPVFSDSGLKRFQPQPASSVGEVFQRVLGAAGKLVSNNSGSIIGLSPDYQALIHKQIEVQTQMQLLSMESNIEKSKHETRMAPIRNLRVG